MLLSNVTEDAFQTVSYTHLVMAMPIASNFTMLSAQYDRDQRLASSATFITTLLSVVTIPVLMGLLFAG